MVSVLFVRKNSIYKQLSVDCWDIDRNALLWPGGNPAIFHPPCRLWSRLKGLSRADESEKMLATWSVDQVRTWGGVLEHPKSSALWQYAGLPLGNSVDKYGGFTLSVDLHWFGFPARKPTLLYIVGLSPASIPAYPISFNAIERVIYGPTGRPGGKELSKAMRDKTPPLMATWLINLCHQLQETRVSG